ncbi:hypothetical protein [Dactylosporangium sp. NPDC051541]|uniref:hypothetical protein n=1 Tax=Dactylosporangium sp. NPDC051541 TaxID=3363977 RepID=UPI0037A533EE
MPSDASGDDAEDLGRPLLIVTAPEVLPFHQLTPQRFEKLVLSLVELMPEVEYCRQWGNGGQSQGGIDLYAPLRSAGQADRRYVTVQCRNTAAMGPADIAALVRKFRSGRWVKKSELFVLATRQGIRNTLLLEAVEAARDSLESSGVRFEIWDGEALSRRLRTLPGIVEEFFGVEASLRYCPGAKRPVARPVRRTMRTSVAALAVVAVAAIAAIVGWLANRGGPTVPDRITGANAIRIVQAVPSESDGFLRLSVVFDNPSNGAETVTGISLILSVAHWSPWLSGHDSYRMSPTALLQRRDPEGFTFSGSVSGAAGEAANEAHNAPGSPHSGPLVELRGEVDMRSGQLPALRLNFDPTTVLDPQAVTELALELPSRMILKRDVGPAGQASGIQSEFIAASLLPTAPQITRIEVAARIGGRGPAELRLCSSKTPPPSSGILSSATGLWESC